MQFRAGRTNSDKEVPLSIIVQDCPIESDGNIDPTLLFIYSMLALVRSFFLKGKEKVINFINKITIFISHPACLLIDRN